MEKDEIKLLSYLKIINFKIILEIVNKNKEGEENIEEKIIS